MPPAYAIIEHQPMSSRVRSWFTTVLIAALSSGLALLLLTMLNHALSLPAVQHFDTLVQARIHAAASPRLTGIMLALTWLGAIKIFAVALAIVLIFLWLRGRRTDVVLLGGAIAGAFLLNETLKQHFRRPRPQVLWSIGDEHTFSFPSGHSLFAVVLYGTLAYIALHRVGPKARRPGLIALALLMPLGIGTSRVYLGMHFPTDVIAGWLAGAVWLAGIVLIHRSWQRHSRTAANRQELDRSHSPSTFK